MKTDEIIHVKSSLREGPREYRPTYTYTGGGKILDFKFDCFIRKPIKSCYENPNINSF